MLLLPLALPPRARGRVLETRQGLGPGTGGARVVVVVAGLVVVVDSDGRVVEVVGGVDVELVDEVLVEDPDVPPGPAVVDVVVLDAEDDPDVDAEVDPLLVVGGL